VAGDWLERHTSQAPAALRARVHQYVRAISEPVQADILVTAGQAALARVLAHPGDRSVALDLLAADALVTLALQLKAQTAPERLEEFATSVLQTTRSGA
jgi:hypothetical protein